MSPPIVCLSLSGGNSSCSAVVTNNGSDWLTNVNVADQPDCSYYLMLPGQTFNCSVMFTAIQTEQNSTDANVTAEVSAVPLSNTSSVIFGQWPPVSAVGAKNVIRL